MRMRRRNHPDSKTRTLDRRKRFTARISQNSSCLTMPSAHGRTLRGRCTTSSKVLTRQGPAWRNGIAQVSSDLTRCREYRAVPKHIGQLPLEILDLRQIVVDDVGYVRVVNQVILVVGLGRIKTLQRIDARDDRAAENMRLLQLTDVGAGDFLLRRIGEKNRGAILAPRIGPLAIQLGRVVCNGEEHTQNLSIRNLRGIELHLD